MRILHLSDTHGLHNQIGHLPEADVIVHSGDFTHCGTEKECLDFLNWFIALPYKHKIFVVGNHDLCLYDADNIEDLPANVHFLQDRGVTVDGVRFYGTGFMHYRAIPPDTQVLVTHEPPLGILDREENLGIGEYGSTEIRKQVSALPALRLHLFGHSHNGYGLYQENGVTFSNGALMAYDIRIEREPRVIEL
ncbi:MAG: metallophosphatase domain-containing protein [Salinivirgaceae bacterium]|nr:metallophosphatase domain-containing protein [Salinivirgaceae bacterium]